MQFAAWFHALGTTVSILLLCQWGLTAEAATQTSAASLFPNTPSGAVPGHLGSRQYGSDTPDIGASRSGTWFLLEYLILGNTKQPDGTPNADGTVRIYVDGKQVVEHTNAINYDRNIPRGTCYWEFAPINGVSAALWERWIDYGPIRIATRESRGTPSSTPFPNSPSTGWNMIWDRDWTQEAVLSGWTPTTPATAPHYGENWYLDDNGTGMLVDIWNTIWRRTPLSYHPGTRTFTFPDHTLEHLGPKPGEDVTFQWAGQRVEIDSPTGWQWFTVQSNTHNRLTLVEPPDFDPTGRRIRRLYWTLLSGSTTTVLQIEPNWFRERQSVKTSPYRNWAGRTIYISDGTRWHQRTIASNTLQTITLNAALGFSPVGKLWHTHFEKADAYRLIDVTNAPWAPGTTQKAHALRIPKGMEGGYSVTRMRMRGNQRPTSWTEAPRTGPLSWPPALQQQDELYLGLWVRYRGDGTNPFRLFMGPQWPPTEDPGRCVAIKTIYGYNPLAGDDPTKSLAHIPMIPFGGDTNIAMACGTQFDPRTPNPGPLYPTHSRTYPGDSDPWMTGRLAQINLGDGNWHLLETYWKGNTRDATSARNDGVCRLYVDGTKVLDTPFIMYTVGQQNVRMAEIDLNPIWGGAQIGVPHDMYVDFGRLRVMAR